MSCYESLELKSRTTRSYKTEEQRSSSVLGSVHTHFNCLTNAKKLVHWPSIYITPIMVNVQLYIATAFKQMWGGIQLVGWVVDHRSGGEVWGG